MDENLTKLNNFFVNISYFVLQFKLISVLVFYMMTSLSIAVTAGKELFTFSLEGQLSIVPGEGITLHRIVKVSNLFHTGCRSKIRNILV